MKLSQKNRIYLAMLQGSKVSRLWAAKQIPLIAQPNNRCNELIRENIPVQKKMVYPSKGAHYMEYWLTEEYINSIKGPNSNNIKNESALHIDISDRCVCIEDIKTGKNIIDMRGSEKWTKKVDRLIQILRIAAPKNLHPPAYAFSSFYYCKDGYWYESNWRERGSVPVLDIVD